MNFSAIAKLKKAGDIVSGAQLREVWRMHLGAVCRDLCQIHLTEVTTVRTHLCVCVGQHFSRSTDICTTIENNNVIRIWDARCRL